MFRQSTISQDLRRLMALAGPVVAAQLGASGMRVVDMAMLGHAGVHELDAAALGSVWAWGTLILGIGMTFGLDPVVSQAHGAGDERRAQRALQSGLVLAAAISAPIVLLWLLASPALAAFGQDAALAADAGLYLRVQAPTVPFFLAFFVLRQFLQGRGVVWPALWITIAANVFNALGNWVLIFGAGPVPALGIEGAGLATGLSRVYMFVALVGWTLAESHYRGRWFSGASAQARALWSVLRHGLPISVQFFLEVWAFQAATLMAGWLGHSSLAAHAVVLNVASLTFTVPFGLSAGAATRVGNLIGAGDHAGARRAGWVAVAVGALFMAGASAVLLLFGRQIAGAYGLHGEALALAAGLLPVAAAFQVFDGVQVVSAGALRGRGVTRAPMLINLLAYYLFALPVAGLLGFWLGQGINGVWWGLCLGLGVVSVALIAVQGRESRA